jgi:hypothetical protein
MALRYILLQCVMDSIVQADLSQASASAAARAPAVSRRIRGYPLFLGLRGEAYPNVNP